MHIAYLIVGAFFAGTARAAYRQKLPYATALFTACAAIMLWEGGLESLNAWAFGAY